ncbi:thialysine N-epsilon-acetyltransferase [Stomoxys calcitrans]|uniref:N-acetyltransferase domain-containing protein n=1 Tax=Stomoxys calcitrans TaxID=35570 RepID=A0A1I8P0Q0_STOCA|nr:thialysine N-epsilon-acetyltransferase [Stomoxys calcitrans]
MATSKNFVFRKAEKGDIKVVVEMIQELADFEKMSDGPKLTEKDLLRDSGLEGGPEYCHIYVLDLIEADKTITIGYSICFFSYSTWQGKSYFLEDIYVRPAYRGIGAGARIFKEVAAKAQQYECKRVDFHVLSWNPASKFYKKLGATDLTEAEEWHFYRLQQEEIKVLANELQNN